MNRIRELREAIDMQQKELAINLGVTQPTVSDWESGKKVPSAKSMAKIAKFFNVSMDYLTGRTDIQQILNADGRIINSLIPITTQRIPILGSIHCGEPTYAQEDFVSYVEVGAEIKADFALIAKGDSMIGARIQDGDLVFIRKQDTVNNGEIAAVIIDDDTALKRVRFLPGGITMLAAENSKYEPIMIGVPGETRVVRILGKAVAFQGDVK